MMMGVHVQVSENVNNDKECCDSDPDSHTDLLDDKWDDIFEVF